MKLFAKIVLMFLVVISLFVPGLISSAADESKSSGSIVSSLPVAPQNPATADWLINPVPFRAGIYRTGRPNEIDLTNGLITRTIRLAPNAATLWFDNLMTGESITRAVRPEAVVEIDGEKYNVGGLVGQVENAYLKPEWADALTTDPAAFQLAGIEIGKTAERFAWKRKRYSPDAPWPPPGVSLVLKFAPPAGKLDGISVEVHYELYDGIPLICKWLTIGNNGNKSVRLGSFVNETLAMVEIEPVPDRNGRWDYPNILVESDYEFNGMTAKAADQTTFWSTDPQYTTQVNYDLKTPVIMESRPPLGPDVDITPGATFESFRTFELIFDSSERERKSLEQRRMYRTIAPWAMENPILMHVRQSDTFTVKKAIDQCAKLGFEMVIMSFGSGFTAETGDERYIGQIKKLVDYAHSKGVEIGGYSLLASRRIDDDNDVINPATGKTGGAVFGNSPCIGSKWGVNYFKTLDNFIRMTGMDVLEHDGSYPGDLCASAKHPGHRGLNDSQWTQWKTITDFYKSCRARGIYLNVPDWYFLSGSNKTGMGYREVNWSLPRERQIILGRQNIFDGTWEKTPSMGWMFVPLMEYHGGGEAATLEPLSKHLDTYGAILSQNFGAGVQACYRGNRLYDKQETLDIVKKWVDFYKLHRAILDSDIIHVRRPDGRGPDCILHVNPFIEEKGLAVVFNPLDEPAKIDLKLPLYYTGLTDSASVSVNGSAPATYKLERDYNITVPVEIDAHGSAWLIIK